MKAEGVHILAQTVSQSFYSALISIIAGFLCAWGLCRLSRGSWRGTAQALLLLPSVLPSLYVATSALQLFFFLKMHFYGLGAVVAVHVLMNMGLVGVTILHLVENKMGAMLELALVEGAHRGQILKVILGYLHRELTLIFFFVFTASFVSLSVPLLVGGETGATLEVLIYRMALAYGEYQSAIVLSLFQILLLATFSFFLRRPWPVSSRQIVALRVLGSPFALGFSLSLVLLIVAASMGGFVTGLKQMWLQPELLGRLPELFIGSFIECGAVATLVLVLLNLYLYLWPQIFLHRVSLAVSAPSTVLIALVIYKFFDAQGMSDATVLLVIAVGFLLTIWPTLYRLRGYEVLSRVEEQMALAKVMGASRRLIYCKVTLPQVWADFAFIAGVAAFWASGDFALSSMIVGRDLTMAMMAQTLIGGYRIEVATATTWLALAVGAVVFLILQGVGRVGYKKSYS